MKTIQTGVMTIRDASHADILPIAFNMRQSDIDEIWASNNLTPAEALKKGVDESIICLTAHYGRDPVAMFGLVPMPNLTGEATIWFLSTQQADDHKLAWGRMSKHIVEVFQRHYPTLYNYVDVRNQKSIEWLKWLGAKFLDPAPYGVEGMPFRLFMLKGQI